ncbi:alpha/beta fold hydrolase [Polaromonas sp.]|jgi:pimeloyl-ACP methyl ester carboxylesterase|uniref:alpha/beta fold hydrolase n=1 Tax=Polaromonas sp. TaxID=1869339 RepID=UPI002D1DA5E1|nr:alpha/beta fold hydrolase [Polaromonas sp.]HQS30433.1 alpha/beta fold hydrolase [Polaromonas sp.]HQS90834.1 alpha/beta fold hydrolase [Polaromonas sp.]
MKIRANGIQIEVEDSGAGDAKDAAAAAARPVVLLIMGLGMQLTAWPPAMVQALVDAGLRVVRFDNRDIGLSQHFDHLGQPNVLWQGLKYRLGWRITPPYSLQDMANDALGVMDALALEKVHIVGVSMGGMIAQRLALTAPGRAWSLASVMSSSGARGLPAATGQVTRALMSRPANKTLQAEIDHAVKLFKLIGSPGYPMDEAELRARVAASTARSYHPQGFVRQMIATVADAQRADALAGLKVPTLVVHGRADPLVPFACGADTARRIPGATLAGIDGMGHDLAPGVVERLLPLLIRHFEATRPSARLPAAQALHA